MSETNTTSAHHASDDTYYTPQTLAEKWGCSKDIVYDLLRTGKLQGFKLGRDWRISDEARLAYENAPEHRSPMQYRRSRGTMLPPGFRVT